MFSIEPRLTAVPFQKSNRKAVSKGKWTCEQSAGGLAACQVQCLALGPNGCAFSENGLERGGLGGERMGNALFATEGTGEQYITAYLFVQVSLPDGVFAVFSIKQFEKQFDWKVKLQILSSSAMFADKRF